MSSRKARATNNSASANFAGEDGCRGPSLIQSHAKKGERRITNAAWMDTNHDAYSLMPSSSRWTQRSANRLSVDPACSYAPQKRDAKAKNTTTAVIRFQSSLVNPSLDPGTAIA